MPKEMRKAVPAVVIANISKDGRYMVGGAVGLHLRVAGKSKSWIVRVTLDGKRCDIGLGSFHKVGVSIARKLAKEVHEKIAEGGNPIAERETKREADRNARAKVKTFEECARLYLASQAVKRENGNAKHNKQWAATLETYAYPVIGKRPVATVDTAAILEIIEPLWATKTETASRLRGRIEKVLGWATFRGFRTGENPARWKGHLDHHLPLRSEVRKVKHHAALSYADLGAFMFELRKRDGISARALEFAILCASRSGEVRGATWGEFDLAAHRWTIPEGRMKAGIEHVVPLSDAAVAILEAMRALPRMEREAAAPDYVFPAPRGGALSDMALTAVLKRMDRADLTQHGFRSTFREWAGETTTHPREVIEHALAHQLADKAEAAYQRGSLLPRRVVLMADWAKFCAKVPTGGNVVSIGVAA